MPTPTTLQNATQDRKARLAQLKSLQQKKQASQPPAEQNESEISKKRKSRSPSPDASRSILSGRNYDSDLRGPKLGYEAKPGHGPDTVEARAQSLAEDSKRLQLEDAKAENQAVDLFKLQPKKPTWDLKRHLDKKLEVLNPRTDAAIARMVRERIQNAQKEAQAKAKGSTINEQGEDGEAIGMEGATLVEATREMEKEDAEPDSDDVDDEDDDNDAG